MSVDHSFEEQNQKTFQASSGRRIQTTYRNRKLLWTWVMWLKKTKITRSGARLIKDAYPSIYNPGKTSECRHEPSKFSDIQSHLLSRLYAMDSKGKRCWVKMDMEPPLQGGEHLGRNKYQMATVPTYKVRVEGHECLYQVSADIFREIQEGFPAKVAHTESEKWAAATWQRMEESTFQKQGWSKHLLKGNI